MKSFAGLVGFVTAIALLFVSCKKDETGSFSLDESALFLSQGETQEVTFSASNVGSYTVTSTPEGWDEPYIDEDTKVIVVTAPSNIEDDTDMTGTITFSAKVNGGSTISASLFVGIIPTEDLTAQVANSYLINKKETRYVFDGTKKGDGSSLPTTSVDIIWQSKSSLIQYLNFEDGKVSFYVGADDDTSEIKLGNALLGAYDANGLLLWSWHLWVTDYDPDATDGTVTFNDYEMMTRNLGALAQSYGSTDDILASFGLFYQWGRKDPFIGPSTYQASSGSSAAMYNGSGSRVYLTVEASSAETGTVDYATQHPLTYITGTTQSQNDWLWSARSDAMWSSDTKTVNDPCPYGWQIAPSAAYAGLSIVGTPEATDADKYAWTLGKAGSESLFFGAGRRRYDNSTVQNLYIPLPETEMVFLQTRADDAQPWEGLYWTPETQTSDASAFHFWFEKKTTTGGVQVGEAYARANGMSVRCVRVTR